MNPESIRNIGIAAHIDAGKTTVAERILVETGIERRMGRVEDGTTALDFLAPERDRGITIVSACTHVPWAGHGINLIDTPGHVDFTMEVQRCMRILDGGVLVIDARAGVQAQTETVWRQMKREGVAALALVNKCDLEGVDPLSALESIKDRLGALPLLMQYPLMGPDGIEGLVDLVERRHLATSGNSKKSGPVPPGLHDEVEVLREELVDRVADLDEEFLLCCLEEKGGGVGDLAAAIARLTWAGRVLPVFFGSGLSGVGIAWLLDGVCAYLPSPADRQPWGLEGGVHTEVPDPDPDAPLRAMVFKFQDQGTDELAFLRIYCGTLRVGDRLLNPRTGKEELIESVAQIHAEHGEDLEIAGPGQIVGVTGLVASATGDSLVDPTAPRILQAPPPLAGVIRRILEPREDRDRKGIAEGLARLSHQDASFKAREGPNPGQWTLEGMGELHLEVQVGRLRDLIGVEPLVGKPRVAYCETFEGQAQGAGRIERSLGGELNFGEVELVVASMPRTWPMVCYSSTLQREWTLLAQAPDPRDGEKARGDPSEGAATGPPLVAEIHFAPDCGIPPAMWPAVADALGGEAKIGPRCGLPLAGVAILVRGGSSRPGQDSEAAFAQAAIMALRDALSRVKIRVLEPTMSFEVEVREDYAGAVAADLNGRGAQVEGFGQKGALRTLWGMVPLYSMLGYATGVRSISQGSATYSLRPRGQRVLTQKDLDDRELLFG